MATPHPVAMPSLLLPQDRRGKLIGTRTWGGLVGISGNARLVDGGYISVPVSVSTMKRENGCIEGIGVYPDIEVVDRPEELAKGNDPSIESSEGAAG